MKPFLRAEKPIHQTSVIKVVGPLLAFSEILPQKNWSRFGKIPARKGYFKKTGYQMSHSGCLLYYIDTKLSFVILRSLSASMLMCLSISSEDRE